MRLSKLNFKGYECYIADMRILQADKRSDLYYYGIRHSDDDFSMPVTIEPNVIVNHWGTLVTREPIDHLMDTSTHWHQIELDEEDVSNFWGAIGSSEQVEHNKLYL